jgi:hypothetical protein
MKAIFYTIGVLLFLNYRLFYFFMFHKNLMSFNEYVTSRDTDKLTGRIITIDIIILSLYFFNWIWLFAILTIISLSLVLWKKLR